MLALVPLAVPAPHAPAAVADGESVAARPVLLAARTTGWTLDPRLAETPGQFSGCPDGQRNAAESECLAAVQEAAQGLHVRGIRVVDEGPEGVVPGGCSYSHPSQRAMFNRNPAGRSSSLYTLVCVEELQQQQQQPSESAGPVTSPPDHGGRSKPVCYETRRIDQAGSGSGQVCIPAGEHIVFVGDSTMRYQYEHLAYAVRHGHEAPAVQRVKRDDAADLLGDVGDERSWLQAGDDYSQSPGGDLEFRAYFAASDTLLNDECDCFRGIPCCDEIIENHYFSADGVQMSALQMLGRRPVQGTWLPGEDTRMRKPAFQFAPRWSLSSIDLITNVIAGLNATVVIWNQGLHLADGGALQADEWEALHSAVKNTLQKQGVRFIWKTTHLSGLDYCLPPTPEGQSRPGVDRARIEAEAEQAGSRFEVFPAHEVTAELEAKDYWDNDMRQPHLNPSGNHRLNAAMLKQLYGGMQQQKHFRKDDCASVLARRVPTGNESLSAELPPIAPHQ